MTTKKQLSKNKFVLPSLEALAKECEFPLEILVAENDLGSYYEDEQTLLDDFSEDDQHVAIYKLIKIKKTVIPTESYLEDYVS